MLSTESGRRAVPLGRLYQVCWESSVTQVHGRSAPMSRDQAEFLAHDEAIGTASCRFWIEPMDDDADAAPSASAVHAVGAMRSRAGETGAHGTGG